TKRRSKRRHTAAAADGSDSEPDAEPTKTGKDDDGKSSRSDDGDMVMRMTEETTGPPARRSPNQESSDAAYPPANGKSKTKTDKNRSKRPAQKKTRREAVSLGRCWACLAVIFVALTGLKKEDLDGG